VTVSLRPVGRRSKHPDNVPVPAFNVLRSVKAFRHFHIPLKSCARHGHIKGDAGIPVEFVKRIAAQIFGGTRAEGVYTSRDAYDAQETAANLHLLAIGKQLLSMDGEAS
jgi:hypothetical protein